MDTYHAAHWLDLSYSSSSEEEEEDKRYSSKISDTEDPKEQYSGTGVCGCGGNAEGNVGSETKS